jgi:hypothetical protein
VVGPLSLLGGLVLLVGLGLAGYQLFNSNFAGLTDDPPDPTTSASSPPTSGATKLSIEGATTLDPEPEGDGEENTDRADQAFDGKCQHGVNTNIYRQQFGPGGLKKGVGLVLDLGSRKEVSSVTVTAVGAGTDLQVRVGNDEGDALGRLLEGGNGTDLIGRTLLTFDKATTGRYVLLWLTKLPAVNGGFRGQLAEVTVRGS